VQRAELGRLGRELHIVVGEPTQNRPVAGHKTHIWFELETRGRAAHGSVPEQGENAIYRMAAVLRELQGYAAGPLRGLAPCPAGFTPPTLSVGVIRGGVKENIVPDRCAIQVDGRLLPAQAPDSFLPALVAELGRRAGYELRVNWSRLARGMQTPAGSRLLPALLAAAGAVTGRPVAAGIVNYCTDGGHLAHLGHDTVVFGPGDIGQAHSAVEWLELGQLREAVEILVAAARGLAGRGGAGE
jgi:succinyl-diaminopimelate desuccinylase